MLRTHGEKIESMKNGNWEKIEDDAYLLHPYFKSGNGNTEIRYRNFIIVKNKGDRQCESVLLQKDVTLMWWAGYPAGYTV